MVEPGNRQRNRPPNPLVRELSVKAFIRKTNRLNSIDYLGQKWCFITMCCDQRKPLFLADDSARWVSGMLEAESIIHRFLVDAYCVMPDHLHFLAAGTNQNCNLLAFAKSFKQKTAYQYQQRYGDRLWQKNFYDHVLRANDTSGDVAAYIWKYPVRRGLCTNFEEYPFSGSFTRTWIRSVEAGAWTPPWKQSKMPP